MTPELLAFRPHVLQNRNSTLLGFATITCPESLWSKRDIRGGDPFRPHGLCRQLRDGSLLMDVTVRYIHQEELVRIDVPATRVRPPCGHEHSGTVFFQNLVEISPAAREEITRLICVEAL